MSSPFESTPLPDGWPEQAKSAILQAIAAAHFALTPVRGWCANSPITRLRLTAQDDRRKAEVALLKEELRIKDARMAHIPPRQRPHYPPTARLAILELKAAHHWSAKQTADRFLLTSDTISSWSRRLDESGEGALVQAPTPLNKFPEFVTHLAQRLRTLCPTMGKKRIADMLARAGVHLAASTAGRMVKAAPAKPPPDTSSEAASPQEPSTPDATSDTAPKPERKVVAKYTNHVWGVDLTAMPILSGFWVPWLSLALIQSWPFCWWIALVIDQFSRRVVGFEVFPSAPTAEQLCATLAKAVADAGRAPKYIISDQGPQFRDVYIQWCSSNAVMPRFGAIGKHGSIAVVERLIRSLKDEALRRVLLPFHLARMREEVARYTLWYNEHRPHQSRGGKTPDEVYHGLAPRNLEPRIEPRARYPAKSECAAPKVPVQGSPGTSVTLVVSHVDGAKHLPIVQLKKAA
jgi:transposase InsO family protein